MNHVLRVDLLDRPDVARVVGPVELVACAFLPTVPSVLAVVHKVLATKHRMVFDPGDALGEVQAAFAQRLAVIRPIRKAAPDVEHAAWNKSTRHVAEPSEQDLLEV